MILVFLLSIKVIYNNAQNLALHYHLIKKALNFSEYYLETETGSSIQSLATIYLGGEPLTFRTKSVISEREEKGGGSKLANHAFQLATPKKAVLLHTTDRV